VGQSPFESLKHCAAVFTGTVFWIHLTGVINQSIQTMDTLFLGVFQSDLGEIGRYSIALKAANFFQMLPVALVNPFAVYLGKKENSESIKERMMVLKISMGFACLCLALFCIGIFTAEPLIGFLAKGKLFGSDLQRTVSYFYWLLGSLLVLCVTYPLSTYLAARSKLKTLCFYVYIPWLIVSATLYAASSYFSSGSFLFVAQANLGVYIAYFFLLVLLSFKLKS
jgi:hypothetical protein